MVQSPYREVLYLDSDNVPTRDPEFMFSAPAYLRLRAFQWYDFWKTAAQNPSEPHPFSPPARAAGRYS